jgi:fumarate hydratase subunit beta
MKTARWKSLVEHHVKLPYPPEKLDKFATGDILYLTGTIITARDQAHARILEAQKGKRKLPFPPKLIQGGAIFHCGPLVKSNSHDTHIIISAGPTTSERMDPLTEGISRYLHPSFIIGKGGLSTYRPQPGLPIYLAFPGGCGALAAESIKGVKGVYWEDLGMPEAVWVLEVEDFGPLTVAIDARGKSLYA